MPEDLALNVKHLQQMSGKANMHSAESSNLGETSPPNSEVPTQARSKRKLQPKSNRTAFKRNLDPMDPISQAAPLRSDIKQEIYALRDINNIPVGDEESDEIEIEPSEVTEILPTIDEHNEKAEMDSLFIYKSFQHSFSLNSPKENSMLHIAAWNGNDEIVDLVVEHEPDLLFSFNKNEDSPLHLAARAGNISTVKKLFAAYANSHESDKIDEAWIKFNSLFFRGNMQLLHLIFKKNAKGNDMFHEAMICDKGSIGAKVLEAYDQCLRYIPIYLSVDECLYVYEHALSKTNNAKQSILYLAVEASDKKAVELILNKCPKTVKKPEGLSPVVAAIMKQDKDMLSMILSMKPDWTHLADKDGRLPLHYAALKGYFEGVHFLHGKCNCCCKRRDKYGMLPLHLASHGGHVKVLKELLGYCSDPTQMLDNFLRNILHIAAQNGKHKVVRYILQTPKLEKLINQKDHKKGDTPLHLAARSCHPKTILYLTWDERVDVGLVNHNNQTPLDIVNALYQLNNSSMRQGLAWAALKSAGAKPNSSRVLPVESRSINSKPKEEIDNDKVSDPERYKDSKLKVKTDNVKVSDPRRYNDRVETLTVVSTLIITSSVASCLSVPGGADGTARSIYHVMFQLFIICITLSFFTSVSATIILFWARLGLIELVDYSLKIVMPLLGVSLISLSFAFLAGVYTVISKLQWLATVFLVMTGILIGVVFFLYIVLFLPSTLTIKPVRYLSYCPFLFLASLTEPKTNHGVDT